MNSNFSFLRHRRFTKKGQHRGVSLIELTIGIAILVFILGITLLTVTNRATNVKLENYATQMVGLIKQQRIMISKGLRSTRIQPTEFTNQLQNLFEGVDDINKTGALITVAATGTCSTAGNFVVQITAADLTPGERNTLAAAFGDRLTREFDTDVTNAGMANVFDDDGDDTTDLASGDKPRTTNLTAVSGNVISICFST